MKTSRTFAIVLRRQSLREADRLVTLLTPQSGKLKVLARGVRKPKARWTGFIEPLTWGQFFLAQGAKYPVLTSVALKKQFSFPADFLKTQTAGFFAALAEHFTAEHHRDLAVYFLLLRALSALAIWPENKIFFIKAGFILKLLHHAGFHPDLYFCSRCRKKISSPRIFYVERGLVCGKCASGILKTIRISSDFLKLWRFLKEKPFIEIKKLSVSLNLQKQLRVFLRELLLHYDFKHSF